MFDFDLKGTAEDKDELADSMNNLNVEASSSGQVGPTFKRKPVIIIVVGMAGNPASIFSNKCYYLLFHFDNPCCLLFFQLIRKWEYIDKTGLKIESSYCMWTGSGKTTFLHRLVCHTQASRIRGYVLNLDPAVMTLPYGANIDIRDTVKYKEVMKQFNLGPNGGILTSLNLFATKFDEVKSTCSFFSLDGLILLPYCIVPVIFFFYYFH